MSEAGFAAISREQLVEKFDRYSPNNEDRSEGFALVHVLGREQFARERIPGSTNIPQGQEDAFEERFDKSKEIIVYCASSQCDASEKAARELASRGFKRVFDYQAGLRDWRDAGRPVVGTAA